MSRVMAVVQLSTSDNQGGAARAAYRLHVGLGRVGVESRMLVLHKTSNDPSVVALKLPPDRISRLYRLLKLRAIARLRSMAPYRHVRPPFYERFSHERAAHGVDLWSQIPPCSVVNLHWVDTLLDYPTFFHRLPRHGRLVWTLHDMNPFTGGCHYDNHCGGYRLACGACPQLGTRREHDLSRRIWQAKCACYAHLTAEQMHIVTPSRWLTRMARQSTLFSAFPVTTIPYGLDTTAFAPRDRAHARAVLGLPQDSRVVLFASQSVDSPRKGITWLLEALQALRGVERLLLLSVGKETDAPAVDVPHQHLGSVGNDRLLSLVYSAADLFVIPSVQDNLPNTVLEAIACGTPVVGFDVGGIPDMVRPGITGELVPPGEVTQLGSTIARLLDDPTRRRALAASCRQVAVEEYALEVQAQRYAALYAEMLPQRQQGLSF